MKRRRSVKRVLAVTAAASLLLASMPMAAAANDLDGNWAKAYFEYLSTIPYKSETGGVLRASASTGNYSPEKKVTRAEFMRYINRCFNFTEQTSTAQYTDLSDSAWYSQDGTVATAVKYGYISGTKADKMSPSDEITREQVVTILGRLFKKEFAEVDPSTLDFTDKADIGKWSAAYVKDAVDSGIVAGYNDGSFKPTATVRRDEVASLLYHYAGSSLSTPNTAYTASDIKSDTDNVTISVPCTLQNVDIPGDLYITEGVGTASVGLVNVNVKGEIIQAGGAVTYNNVSAKRLVIESPMDRLIQSVASGDSDIAAVEVRSPASLFERNLAGKGFSTVRLNGSDSPSLVLDATADVTVDKQATISTTANASIGTLTANAPVSVTGYGKLHSAILDSTGCSLAMEPTSGYTLKSGTTATVAGATVTESKGQITNPAPSAPVTEVTPAPDPATPAEGIPTVTVTPTVPTNSISLSSATFDRNKDSDDYQDLAVTLVAVDDAVFRKVVLGGVEVSSSFSRSTITIKADALRSVYPGTYTLTYVMSAGVNPTLRLTIVDTGNESLDGFDYEAEWSGSKRDDVVFRTDKNSSYSSKTAISSIKMNGNNMSSNHFDLKYLSSGRIEITIDGSEIAKWFNDYDDPDYLDFDVKLSEPSELFVVRIR